MDETTIRKRIEQLNASPNMVAFYHAAYADGLKAAAQIVEEGDYDTDIQAIAAIRQHTKEMGYE